MSNSIVIPGSEIPEWFSHQSMGNEVEIKQPSHLYNEWMGTAAICIVFCAHVVIPPCFIDFSLIGNGKRMFIRSIHFLDKVSSDHLLLVHLTPQLFNEESDNLMWEGDVNGFSQFRIKIETRNVGYDSWLKVKKWGFRMIYNKDMEDLDRTMVQYSSSSITTYDGMDVLHHNFDNSSVAVECQKVKHCRDDYNGAGPNGEGSSNDIPNPERIKRHTETHGNSDSEESSEYKDCDEELSDRDESNDDWEEDNDDSDESSVDQGKYSESDLDD
ncbi:hypothetical protein SO802_024768 [Lithocarpus litseifolius]|uniref:C-JID domain-containing protein n=1 Tax=Lithocarpus litseifolius TaxID=425828 RepID=A0AAW2CDM3_9ROSI